ncbi:D-arabinono-1,4-lactone oxidase [Parasphingorhabdus sp.]|uniref:D-arabinono-1,4-lactone oxidase n=1 Tax=Parasphingorhabdus sp. TaxID=2709688 RepID=UPI003267F29C
MAISRRALLLGGAAVAVAIPAGRQIWWSSQDFTREGFSPDLPEVPPGRRAWMNWTGYQKATPQQIAAPTSSDLVADLIKTSPAPIRPVGSSHSFTALVPADGTIIDVGALAGLTSHDTEAQTARLGAGTRLQQAARLLSEQGLAFPNLPDIDVQTLAGGFSTGTHGTGRNLTAIHDYVRGFELVTASGEILDVSADKNPELFQAGKVSLGSLGVITRYDLKLDKAFALRRQVWLEKIDSLLDRYHALSKKHRNFEILYFPGTGFAAAFAHDLHDGPVKGQEPSGDEDFVAGLRDLRDVFGWWPWLREKVAAGEIAEGPVEDTTDEAWKLLATSRPTKFNEMEYHMALDKGIDTLREVIAMMEARKSAYFPIEARVTAPDDAWLSPFNDGHRMSIAIHAEASEEFDFFFSEFEPLFLRNGGRPHWGKFHSLEAEQLSELYPQFDAFNALRKQLDPTGKFVSRYMAKIWGET